MKLFVRILIAVLICTGAFLLVAKKTLRHVAVLLVNGNVRTLDAVNSRVTAIAIQGGRIVETGSEGDLRMRCTADTVIDLRGQTVLPGLIDGHAHMFGLGQLLQSVNLVGVRSPRDAAERVRDRIQNLSDGRWVYGRGWDQNLWQVKELPTSAMLEGVADDHPVVLIRIDGHAIWVNRRAMEIAQITRATKDPDGGKIIRSGDGTPTGVFLDNARELVEKFVPPPGPGEIEQSILLAAGECVKSGLTEVYDMGVDSNEIAVYQKLIDEHRLPLRIYAAIGAPSATWDVWKGRPPLIGYGNGMLTVRAMKMYVDGALGSRGAALVEAYADDQGNRGLTINEKSLEPEARIALQRGYQVCVHAIGDRGNHIVLDCYDKLSKENPPGDYRLRIEHAQVLLPEDIGRFATLKVLPSMQPVHATSDMYWAESRLGAERIHGAYAWRSLLKTGTPIIGGSDFPNDAMSPLRGFYAAVTRSDPEGYPEDGWYREQCMTREEAARCYTGWAAYGGFEEASKGSIEP
jgi:predicted amidohydrolase YtcJ